MDYFIYTICYDPKGPVKIGITRNPLNRLKQLQTGNEKKLHLTSVRNFKKKAYANFAEGLILGELIKKKLKIGTGGNEWFDISIQQAEHIIQYWPIYFEGNQTKNYLEPISQNDEYIEILDELEEFFENFFLNKNNRIISSTWNDKSKSVSEKIKDIEDNQEFDDEYRFPISSAISLSDWIEIFEFHKLIEFKIK